MDYDSRHAAPELASEALENHYKERIKTLEDQLTTLSAKLTAAEMANEQKDITIRVLEAKADEFGKALAEMTVKAVLGGGK